MSTLFPYPCRSRGTLSLHLPTALLSPFPNILLSL